MGKMTIMIFPLHSFFDRLRTHCRRARTPSARSQQALPHRSLITLKLEFRGNVLLNRSARELYASRNRPFMGARIET